MAVKRIQNPARGRAVSRLTINCWAGCWIHASWAGCWGKGKVATNQLDMIQEQLVQHGAPKGALEMLRRASARK
jgi:hypothetical protein